MLSIAAFKRLENDVPYSSLVVEMTKSDGDIAQRAEDDTEEAKRYYFLFQGLALSSLFAASLATSAAAAEAFRDFDYRSWSLLLAGLPVVLLAPLMWGVRLVQRRLHIKACLVCQAALTVLATMPSVFFPNSRTGLAAALTVQASSQLILMFGQCSVTFTSGFYGPACTRAFLSGLPVAVLLQCSVQLLVRKWPVQPWAQIGISHFVGFCSIAVAYILHNSISATDYYSKNVLQDHNFKLEEVVDDSHSDINCRVSRYFLLSLVAVVNLCLLFPRIPAEQVPAAVSETTWTPIVVLLGVCLCLFGALTRIRSLEKDWVQAVVLLVFAGNCLFIAGVHSQTSHMGASTGWFRIYSLMVSAGVCFQTGFSLSLTLIKTVFLSRSRAAAFFVNSGIFIGMLLGIPLSLWVEKSRVGSLH